MLKKIGDTYSFYSISLIGDDHPDRALPLSLYFFAFVIKWFGGLVRLPWYSHNISSIVHYMVNYIEVRNESAIYKNLVGAALNMPTILKSCYVLRSDLCQLCMGVRV